jgi:hypothetical protein
LLLKQLQPLQGLQFFYSWLRHSCSLQQMQLVISIGCLWHSRSLMVCAAASRAQPGSACCSKPQEHFQQLLVKISAAIF